MNKNYTDLRNLAATILGRELDSDHPSLPEARIREVVSQYAATLGITDVDTGALVAELEASFQTVIGIERALVGRDEGWAPWLAKRKADITWRFWDRYRSYLNQSEGWPVATLDRLDQTTDKVLGYLTEPVAPGAWDRRGMVVGHVQSGKTSNYVGLVCKAADAGYKIIIVLAGFHKSLRSQTQIRLEEGFLGYDRASLLNSLDGGSVRVGVGDAMRYGVAPVADSITTRADDGDFKRTLAKNFAINPGGHPLLFVVKKNASVLKNLLDWVRWAARDKDEKGRPYIKRVPLLVIDDEADQGSIDTRKGAFDADGKPDEEHDPTVLNAHIRQLLHTFDQSAYVGYTATPFANILIHEQGRTKRLGQDLFPRSFILSLPAPSNYVGPSQIFGFEGDEEDSIQGLPVIREVTDHAASLHLREECGWVPPRHDKHWMPRYEGLAQVPPSLREAIRAFVLVCAARSARGDEVAHNTMLVHVTRFTAVQHRVAEQVGDELADLQRRLRHGDGGASAQLRDELRDLWQDDFEVTRQEILARGMGRDCAHVSWEELEPLLERAAFSIQVREINGAAGDVLDYLNHKGAGLNVVAIGGDKLSRGLTLEGLSVSYFLRASRMYDTLMQMGRWFGYRPRFLDLCRLYTTSELVDWFSHIAAASEELRGDFNRMVASGGTPRDFGHRVQSHPAMLVTSAVKMRSGTTLDLTFAGDMSETINFWRSRPRLAKNWAAASALIERAEASGAKPIAGTVRKPVDAAESHVGQWVWRGVPTDAVLGFLTDYREHDASKRVKTSLLADYIQRESVQGRLTEWTIFLASGKSERERALGSARIRLATRGWKGSAEDRSRLRAEGHYRIGRLLDPEDEGADFTSRRWEQALMKTQKLWDGSKEERGTASRPDGPVIRSLRDPTRGLLLLYLLDWGSDEEAKVEPDAREIPIVGFGISFPQVDAAHATKVRYVVNNVYWQQELGFSDDLDEEES
ncbi:MAG: Z1 domain-containing protein [Deltaproteobacteria bacterium]|nr:Z1 domain-containing protein [Deltaproteobacteria bacterium]